MNSDQVFETLRLLLNKRLAVIADHHWRDRDPAGHLEKLKEVSEALLEAHLQHANALPPRLNHFLAQASYQKALEWIEGNRHPCGH